MALGAKLDLVLEKLRGHDSSPPGETSIRVLDFVSKVYAGIYSKDVCVSPVTIKGLHAFMFPLLLFGSRNRPKTHVRLNIG